MRHRTGPEPGEHLWPEDLEAAVRGTGPRRITVEWEVDEEVAVQVPVVARERPVRRRGGSEAR